MSEHKIIKNNPKHLIICFGGMALKMGMILPFEFLNYLSTLNLNDTDLYFYVDNHQCWYHKGFDGITKNIDESVTYLNNIIKQSSYKKIIFMGVSSGGYASILFGSLCNVTNVIAFGPRTTYHEKMSDSRYYNLKNIINTKTKYTLNTSTAIKDVTDNHHISQCTNINSFKNVNIIKNCDLSMKRLRDNGTIKRLLVRILQIPYNKETQGQPGRGVRGSPNGGSRGQAPA